MTAPWKLIDIPKITDQRGNLSFLESPKTIPFDLKRIYYLYDVPAGESRGAHAHRDLNQIMIALAGSFSVTLTHGAFEETFVLELPDVGLVIPPMTWRSLHSFSASAVCLVLASQGYDEADYIRDRKEFDQLSNKRD